jgi:hypothetical protein
MGAPKQVPIPLYERSAARLRLLTAQDVARVKIKNMKSPLRFSCTMGAPPSPKIFEQPPLLAAHRNKL